MRHPRRGVWRLSLSLLLCTPLMAAEIHHDIHVRLYPAEHAIEIRDAVTFSSWPPQGPAARFLLHAGLEVASADDAFLVKALPADERAEKLAVPLREYELRPAGGAWPADAEAILTIEGRIHHPLVSEGEEYARSFSRTPGTIGEEGVFLGGGTRWLPSFGEGLLTYDLTVDLPEGWDAVSQGKRTRHEEADGRRITTWECPHPMEEVYLVAAPFTEYSRAAGSVTLYAFLRAPDPNLASKYLETTAQYLEMYRKLIGPYPFEKFALVENFWQTGYGMPSFTLLGPKIIRFPFILHSSYPHEILHNWWGNSVYVDWERGNWCEGLTAYLADHLIKEGQGRGVEYRRDTLKKYRSYVREGRDFRLSEFRSRHSGASEAVGYGKSLMLWHMLRIRLGEERFVKGLQTFYRRFRFKKAAFGAIEGVFSEVSGNDLKPFFAQWVERTGAPVLEMRVVKAGGGALQIEVEQTQEGDLYDISVPVAITMRGVPEARVSTLVQTQRKAYVVLFGLAEEPIRVDLDPWFDVFRRLDRDEIPPTLGELFGAEKVTILLPPEEDPLGAAWRDFATAWTKGEVEVVEALEALPPDRAVWVLGSENRWRDAVAGAPIEEKKVLFGTEGVSLAGHSYVAVGRHPGNPDLAVGWIGSDVEAALPGLARKLPHYGKYSYLAFQGDEPTNVVKGVWPATDSPLVAVLAEGAERGSLPPREPLARLAPVFDQERMIAHVRLLASDEMAGRGIGTEGLRKASGHIASTFEEAGLRPGGDDAGWLQSWAEPDGPDGGPVELRNVIGVLPGTRAEWEGQSVVLGAHYDHLGLGWPDARAGERGKVHNGADDNASGVAVMLEVANLLARETTPSRTIVFVAFTGEEWDLKGSRHYVRVMERWPAAKATGMINLDTVGRLEGKKPILLGSGTAREWIHIAMGVGYTTGVEVTCVADDPGGSDQVSFHEVGVPAVQVFSGPHEDYHRPTDDIERIDAEGLVKIATFVREALLYLSEREEPMTSSLGGAKPPRPAGGKRKVSLGTMPAFDHPGPGVRVAAVGEGSPAEKAGIQEGDVLLAIDGEELKGLRGFSEALGKREPGDVIRIRLRRGEEELELEATLAER